MAAELGWNSITPWGLSLAWMVMVAVEACEKEGEGKERGGL